MLCSLTAKLGGHAFKNIAIIKQNPSTKKHQTNKHRKPVCLHFGQYLHWKS